MVTAGGIQIYLKFYTFDVHFCLSVAFKRPKVVCFFTLILETKSNLKLILNVPFFYIQVPNTTEFAHSLINCNVVSVTRMCLLVLEKMVQRKKGLILNISSASAVLPTPLMTMYSSTKVKKNPSKLDNRNQFNMIDSKKKADKWLLSHRLESIEFL